VAESDRLLDRDPESDLYLGRMPRIVSVAYITLTTALVMAWVAALGWVLWHDPRMSPRVVPYFIPLRYVTQMLMLIGWPLVLFGIVAVLFNPVYRVSSAFIACVLVLFLLCFFAPAFST
jgi:hypothetical protein